MFLAMMTTATTKATLLRRTIWTKCRNLGFFKETIRSWNAHKVKELTELTKDDLLPSVAPVDSSDDST